MKRNQKAIEKSVKRKDVPKIERKRKKKKLIALKMLHWKMIL